ncbi:hypothetical protein [Streptomyces tibetensis]
MAHTARALPSTPPAAAASICLAVPRASPTWPMPTAMTTWLA